MLKFFIVYKQVGTTFYQAQGYETLKEASEVLKHLKANGVFYDYLKLTEVM